MFISFKSSRKRHDYEVDSKDIFCVEIRYIENQYSNIITREDIEKFLEKFVGSKRDIYRAMMAENLTDKQIANRFQVSRQYANRLRRQLRDIVGEIYSI